MVFRKEIFRKIGFFNPALGRNKGQLYSGEDDDLIYARARKKGCKILFLPNAEVFHLVRSERLTLRYIFRWAYYSGKSQKIGYGINPKAFYHILKSLITLINPFIKTEKSYKIQKIARIFEALGTTI